MLSNWKLEMMNNVRNKKMGKTNMIIWIDGTYGVGKTTVASKIKEMLSKNNVYLLESDSSYQEMKDSNAYLALGGAFPQNNLNFINKFKNEIDELLTDSKRIIIVDMSLTQKECKEGLFDHLTADNILHFILTASKEFIKLRILNDNKREEKVFALEHLDENLLFLENNFKDAIWIDVENKNSEDIAKIIIKYINMQNK